MHSNLQLLAPTRAPLATASALEEALAICLETCAQLALDGADESRAQHLWDAADVLRSSLGYGSLHSARTRGLRRDAADSVSRRSHGFGRLTAREWEVVQLLARGWSNQQIAIELVITVRTAESHVQHILAKLGLRSRIEVVTRFHELRGRDPRSGQD